MHLSSLFVIFHLHAFCYRFFLCLIPFYLHFYTYFQLILIPPLSCPVLSYTLTCVLDSVRGGDVHHIFAFLPTEDIYSSLSRGQDKDYFICWNTFKKHIQWERLLPTGDGKKKKPCEDNDCNKCQQQNAFCNFTWFLDHCPYFEEKLPPETAPSRNTAGSKAVMTFLTALGLNSKGI